MSQPTINRVAIGVVAASVCGETTHHNTGRRMLGFSIDFGDQAVVMGRAYSAVDINGTWYG